MADILYIPELAKIIGKTETAVRNHAYRRSSAVPPSFKLGGQYAWHQADVAAWIERKREEAGSAGYKRGRGRPRKST